MIITLIPGGFDHANIDKHFWTKVPMVKLFKQGRTRRKRIRDKLGVILDELIERNSFCIPAYDFSSVM